MKSKDFIICIVLFVAILLGGCASNSSNLPYLNSGKWKIINRKVSKSKRDYFKRKILIKNTIVIDSNTVRINSDTSSSKDVPSYIELYSNGEKMVFYNDKEKNIQSEYFYKADSLYKIKYKYPNINWWQEYTVRNKRKYVVIRRTCNPDF